MSLEKNILTAIAFLAFSALGAALVSQHVFDMQPCAWCVLQRVIYIVILMFALIGLIMPALMKPALGFITLTGATGAGVAVYQVTVASNSLSCDLTLADRIISGSGLDAAAPWLFGVYASCFDAAVDLLGVEYAIWSLILFVVLALAALMTLVAGRPSGRRQTSISSS